MLAPVATLSKNVEQLIWGLKKRNKYRSQVTIQPQNKNWNCLIDLRFTKVNRLLVLPFVRNVKEDHRDSFSHYYVPNVKIKDFNVLIDGKCFLDLPAKNEEEAYELSLSMSRNNDYMTGIFGILPISKKITD